MRIRIFIVLAALLIQPPVALTATDNRLVVERIVVVMRHGIRPPIESPPMPITLAPGPWPAWPVPSGYLTPHGAAAITLLGAYERQLFAGSGLWPASGCLSPHMVTLYADTDERTEATGVALASGLSPGCPPIVGHAAHAPDTLFSSQGPWPGFNPATATAAMIRAAGGSLDAPVNRRPALFLALQGVIAPGSHAFLDLSNRILPRAPDMLPTLRGQIPAARSAAIAFSMEYAEGMPMRDVAWGRADRNLVLQFLAFHSQEFAVTLRPRPIARFAAAPLARRIAAALTDAESPPVTIIVGHDTNIATLGGLWDLHWQLADYPPDEPAPGGGLIFTLLRDHVSGARYVTVRYLAQTLDQMRGLSPLTAAAPPPATAIAIPGCGQSVDTRACPLDHFIALVPNPG
jgi:4-phytase/acid phosphatase